MYGCMLSSAREIWSPVVVCEGQGLGSIRWLRDLLKQWLDELIDISDAPITQLFGWLSAGQDDCARTAVFQMSSGSFL